MNKGFIKIQRKIIEWEWYDDTPTFRLFFHLLIKANFEDKNWHGDLIKRGEIITSISHLAEETGLTQKQVRRAIENLKTTGEIKVETTNRYTKIKIKNYSKYQDKGKQKTSQNTDKQTGTDESQNSKGKQKANKGQTKGKQRATTKEYKELKNDKKDDISFDISSKKKSDKRKFIPPTVDEVLSYCRERKNKVDAEAFVDFYSSKDWMIGKNKMKDWKACVRTWERRQTGEGKVGANGIKIKSDRDTSLDHIFRR